MNGIIEDDEEEISRLLSEVKEEEIEDSRDIRDEENIPQQSAMSDQSNCGDSDPLPQIPTNANDGEDLMQSTFVCL